MVVREECFKALPGYAKKYLETFDLPKLKNPGPECKPVAHQNLLRAWCPCIRTFRKLKEYVVAKCRMRREVQFASTNLSQTDRRVKFACTVLLFTNWAEYTCTDSAQFVNFNGKAHFLS